MLHLSGYIYRETDSPFMSLYVYLRPTLVYIQERTIAKDYCISLNNSLFELIYIEKMMIFVCVCNPLCFHSLLRENTNLV